MKFSCKSLDSLTVQKIISNVLIFFVLGKTSVLLFFSSFSKAKENSEYLYCRINNFVVLVSHYRSYINELNDIDHMVLPYCGVNIMQTVYFFYFITALLIMY